MSFDSAQQALCPAAFSLTWNGIYDDICQYYQVLSPTI